VILLVLLGYAAVTVAYTLPLSTHLATHIRGLKGVAWAPLTEADAYLCLWIVAWDAHAIVTQPLRLFDANILYPAPATLAGSESMLGYAPLAVPLYWVSGNPVLAAQGAMLGSYAVGALGTFLLVRRWTSAVPALVAGLAYGFAPWRVPEVNTLPFLGTHAWPFLVLAAESYVQSGAPLAFAGVVGALLASALVSVYWGYAAFLLLGTYALARARRLVRHASRAAGLLAAVLVAVLLFAPVMAPYLRLRQWNVLPASSPGAFPLELLPLLLVGYGLPPLALAIIALGALLRLRTRAVDAASGAWPLAWAVLALACLLSLGSRLVLLSTPFSLPLPSLILARYVPGFATVRATSRFITLATLALAVMLGLALEEVRRRAGTRGGIVMGALVVLLTVELAWYRRPLPIEPVAVGAAVPPVYRHLREHGEGRPVLELPASGLAAARSHAHAMYFSTYHWLPIVNGHSGHLPPTRDFLMRRAARLPAPDALQELVNLVDLGWIVVHRRALTPGEAGAWDELPPGLERAGRFDGDDLYRVVLPPRPDLRAGFRRWYEATTTLTGTPLATLPAAARRGELTSPSAELAARAGIPLAATVVVRNTSTITWPAYGVTPRHLVVVHARWASGAAPGPAPRDETFSLPADVEPGERVTITIQADTTPLAAGEAWLEVTLAQDGTDFPPATAPPLRLPLRVSRGAP
jgi:hypothetical protein